MFRIGFWVDLHRFQTGPSEKKLMLGGVLVPNHAGVDSHSDGDVILHALFNALSSAIGEKSIGQFFLDTDEKNKGKDSKEFIAAILDRVRKQGYTIGNVVFSLECKTPKISHLEKEIKQKVSALLDVDPSCVAVHATSGEGLTSFGKGEGIYCQAVVLLYKK